MILMTPPAPNSRSILVGKTGSGKSTLAKAIIARMGWVVAIDPKPSLGLDTELGYLPGYALCRTPEELVSKAREHARLQYRPDPEYQDEETYDRVYYWCYKRSNTYVYTDEAYLVLPPSGRAGLGLRACITSGRERGVGMLTATQRPAAIDQRLISECDNAYVFALRKPEDRKRMSDCLGWPQVMLPAEGHSFWACSDDCCKYCRLDL